MFGHRCNLITFKHDGSHKKVQLSYWCIHYTKTSLILIPNLSKRTHKPQQMARSYVNR